ncbi:tetratricopeptide repeat protein [Odoribacter lunatus]|uniref:tetratricopeptide repeat protein n=1 Tax=Odoribacter lunatus TaxID=2941335 RepID=UPI00203C20F1|nr:hypothetical protein [Odoribacter lunatus]
MRKIGVFVFFALLLNGGVKAQTLDSKFGVDSIKTIEHASVYQEFVKQKNYRDALPSWWYVFNNAPKFQLKTYTQGVIIMRNMYAQTKNPAYIDTLMMIYDQRVKNFGNEGAVLGQKGYDLYQLTLGNDAKTKEAFGYLSKSFELQGAKTDPQIAKMLFAVADDLLKKGLLTKDEYIQLYLKVTEYAEGGKNHPKKAEQYGELKTTADAFFFNAGVADCATLNSFLAPKFEKEPGNVDVLKEIARFLKRSECTELPLFTNVAEALYKADPSAEAAYNLAILFLKRQEYDKTEAYLKEAIEKGTDPLDKAEYYLRMAQISLSKKQFAEAKKHSLEALKLNPNLGAAYMVIGKAYAFGNKSYGEDDFDHASVFWVAVDKFNKAKQVDASVAEEANELIKTYSQYFPSKDEAFFRGVQPGNTFKVGGWINESTTARFR